MANSAGRFARALKAANVSSRLHVHKDTKKKAPRNRSTSTSGICHKAGMPRFDDVVCYKTDVPALYSDVINIETLEKWSNRMNP